MQTRRPAIAALCLLTAMPGMANAHMLGADHDIMAGLLHPLTGADHLLTLLAAGFWAARLGRTTRIVVPLVLLFALLTGALFAMSGVRWSLIEPALWSSVLVMAWLALRGVALGAFVGCVLSVTVGVLHGYAHAVGFSVDHNLGWFATGMMMTSAALLGAGAALAHTTRVVPPTVDTDEPVF